MPNPVAFGIMKEVLTALGHPEREFRAIAIVAGPKGENRTYPSPCGICRQVMREFCDPKEMTVLLAKTPEDYLERTLEDLLPDSFGPGDSRMSDS